MYRGACTSKDWSNTTACPTFWCNDSKHESLIFVARLSCRPIDLRAADKFVWSVFAAGWSNIWHCPVTVTDGYGFFWCGNHKIAHPCGSEQNVSVTQSVFYDVHATILGLPPLISTPTVVQTSTLVLTSSITVIRTENVTPSKTYITVETTLLSQATHSTNITLTPTTATSIIAPPTSPKVIASTSTTPTTMIPTLAQSPRPSQNPPQAPTTAIAIGTGVGVPLSIASMAFLGFILWRRAKSRAKTKARISKTRISKPLNVRGSRRELGDTSIPWELDHTVGKAEAIGHDVQWFCLAKEGVGGI